MLKSKWRLKNVWVDPVTGYISLYWFNLDGRKKVLITHTNEKEHIWTGLPDDFPVEEARRHAKIAAGN